MARITLGALTTINTSTHFDAMYTELYDLRELITTASYTAATPKITLTSSGLRDMVVVPGTTRSTSLIRPLSDQTTYSLLAGPTAGPGLQARWDSATTNRYFAFGIFDGAGTWTEYARFQESDFFITGSGKLGYGTGAGGTVTQATSKSTGVTLNKATGQITMNAASLAANTAVSFTLTNSVIAATDVIPPPSIASGATAGAYVVAVDAVAAGSCRISVRNLTGGALAEALVLNFVVLKGATS